MRLIKNSFIFLLVLVYLQGFSLQAAKGFDATTKIDHSKNDSITKPTIISILDSVQIVGLEHLVVNPKIKPTNLSITPEKCLSSFYYESTEELTSTLFYVTASANVFIAPNTILVDVLEELSKLQTVKIGNKILPSVAKTNIEKASFKFTKASITSKKKSKFPSAPKQDTWLSVISATGSGFSFHTKVKVFALLNAPEFYFIQNSASKPHFEDNKINDWFCTQKQKQNKAPPTFVVV